MIAASRPRSCTASGGEISHKPPAAEPTKYPPQMAEQIRRKRHPARLILF